jgi:hypothetical protein
MSMADDDIVANVADEEQVKRGERKAKRRVDQWKKDLLTVLDTPAGERVLQRIVAEAGLFQESFSESHARMAFREGQRNLARWLLTEVERVRQDAVVKLITRPTQQETNNG